MRQKIVRREDRDKKLSVDNSQYMMGTTNQKQMMTDAIVFISDHH
jgi:hypothetical protein